MASVSKAANGTRRIEFFNASNERKCIRLGRVSQKQAESIKTHVEHLAISRMSRQPVNRETAAWVADLESKLREKIERVGLIEAAESKAAPELEPAKRLLGPFIDHYIADRPRAKPRTVIHYRQVRKALCEYFGDSKPLAEVTVADVKAWRRWLENTKLTRTQGRTGGTYLSESTVKRRCSFARQFFAEAVDAELIARNPFAKMKDLTVGGNKSREFFISREVAAKILDACPDAEWRLIFALSRYGGLRCPSEHLAITWGDVDWVGGRLTVHVPKLEHHGEKHATRVIPIFPEIRPYLDDAFALAGEQGLDPTAPIINRYRDANANLRTQLNRIIKRAAEFDALVHGKTDLKPWPRLFQNLRATRQTELAHEYPLHVVCAWIGNSQAVAKEHYLQVTDADFAKAAGSEKAPQKAQQKGAETSGKEGQRGRGKTKTAEKIAISAVSESIECSLKESNLEPTD